MKLSSEYLMSEKGLELLGKLFHNSGEGIMLFNSKGKMEMMNPRAEEMFGYTEQELLGKPVELLIPKDAQSVHKKHRSSYMKNPSPRSMGQGLDLKGLKKDGSSFPIEISLNYVKHQEEMMVVSFITDITVRKKNEEMVLEQQKKLEEYADELEKKVKSRTSELEHMNLGLQSQIQERKLAEKALKKSLEDLKKAEKDILKSLQREKELGQLKSRFVSMASHEFRTPLTTILSSANLINKYVEADQKESREKHVGRITKSVQNLTNILNDFLSLEKLESGQLKVAKTALDLKELLEEIIDEMQGSLKAGQTIQLDCKPIQMGTDEHIIRNMLFNLLSNASKYSKEKQPIYVSVTSDKKEVAIAVRDEGMGIPKEEQKNMFERFFRADNATNIQGTGLGLNIVKKYVELLGGKIEFESTEGKGSTFTLSLPNS